MTDVNSRFTQFGLRSAQVEWVDKVFVNLFEKEKFDTVIEIGTFNGVFAYWVNKEAKLYNFKFVTFDIENKLDELKTTLKSFLPSETLDLDFREGDCFGDMYDVIIDLIKNGGKVLLLCDGGNKIKEFNTFAPHLKGGDFIMTHDYGKTKEFFNENFRNKIWPSHESWDDALKIKENGLIKRHTKICNDAVWSCFRKKIT